MKFTAAVVLSLLSSANAFVGPIFPAHESKTCLCATSPRRDALINVVRGSGFVLGTVLGFPTASKAGTANPFFEEEVNNEPSQMARSDKLDINGAFVTDYKQFPGMYPHAAGKIASHGPYKQVADIYNIPGITEHDRAVFNKYKGDLIVLPPGRMYKERINQRQST